MQYGNAYDSYLVTEPGWEYFWSAQRRGLVALARQGRHLFSSGGLLAPEDHQEDLLSQLVEYAQGRRETLSFFNIREEQLPLFSRWGFQATKWGEEALVDLPDLTWAGKNYDWVRRQANYCRRQGVVVSEFQPVLVEPAKRRAIVRELAEVSEMFLAGKPQSSEIRFLQGRFDARNLANKRVFIARGANRHANGTGRIEGFLACNPSARGRTWVMETYRQRPDAVRGTIAYTMYEAMSQFKNEGVQSVSLCLLPGLRCREALPGDSALVRWGLALGTGNLSMAFETAGAYHFKSRFRPRFENRYICVRPRMTLGTAVAFVKLLGVLRLDIGKFCRLGWERWQKRVARATLAK
jgi:phosphatidylglycerol lysyltransferase